jgi:hypothetical protein
LISTVSCGSEIYWPVCTSQPFGSRLGFGLADRVICASAYLIPFACNHLLGPRFKHRWNRS